ncbi:MAG: rhodanese-like domain-containing protein [Cyanobacteria bacterium]|nr:rhodanese-like domain-containing protein [Cyanobacteriota bacterium]
MAQLASKALVIVLLAVVVPALSSVALAKEEQAIRNVPRISIDELKVLMEQKSVLVLDVRDPESFAKGSIPGAVNVDYTQVLKQAEKFAGEKRTIVAYCACANEMTAARASVDLAAKGIAGAKALKGGWDEWVQRGERVER